MLTFSTTEDTLLVSGKTIYIKDAIKDLGGRWNKRASCWALPIFLDSDSLREAMLGDALAAYTLRRLTKRTRDTVN
jgi:hypothetical protein